METCSIAWGLRLMGLRRIRNWLRYTEIAFLFWSTGKCFGLYISSFCNLQLFGEDPPNHTLMLWEEFMVHGASFRSCIDIDSVASSQRKQTNHIHSVPPSDRFQSWFTQWKWENSTFVNVNLVWREMSRGEVQYMRTVMLCV